MENQLQNITQRQQLDTERLLDLGVTKDELKQIEAYGLEDYSDLLINAKDLQENQMQMVSVFMLGLKLGKGLQRAKKEDTKKVS